MMTSATLLNSPPIRFGLVSCGACQNDRLCSAVSTAPGTDYRMSCPVSVRSLIGRWLLLINFAHIVKESLRFWPGVRVLRLPNNHPGTPLTQTYPKAFPWIRIELLFVAP